MKSKKVKFKNKEGLTLGGRIDFPLEDQPRAYAIFAHCFTCTKNLRAVKNIANALTAEGIAVLLFDFTGLGESEGDFSESDFSSNVQDLIAASDFIANEYTHTDTQFLIGHSLGGAAVLKAANQLDRIKTVITIAAPFDPMHVSAIFEDQLDTIKEKGKAEVNIGGRSFQLSKQFLQDIEAQKPEEEIAQLRKPLLVLHSPQDNIVGIDNAAKIYNAAIHPKNFISLDGADHLMSEKRHSLYAGRMIANWLEAWMEKEDIQTNPDERPVEGFVRAVTGDNKYTTQIKTARHKLLADEPKSVGGSDLGPSPYDLMASALASCTSMTLCMYAERKEWPLEEVIVDIKHEKKHKPDVEKEQTEKKEPKIDHFDRQIELRGDLSDDQRKRLMEIADKCPVHRTLKSNIEVKTSMKD